jgi:oligopeptide/dipeptide ABC transporter ATP-binding protein
MYAGQLAETGSVSQLHGRPLHPYSVRLLGSVPDLSGERHLPEGIPGQPPSPEAPVPGCRFHPRCDRAMAVCTAEAPPIRSFGEAHAVACHAVSDDGRLRAPEELPVLASATQVAVAAAEGAEVVIEPSTVVVGADDDAGAAA